jgi:ZIP family zinc transporter
VTTTIGVLFAVVIRENARLIAIGLGFSTGIMMAVSIMDLIPTAITHTGLQETVLMAALGACVLWLANVVIPHIHLTAEHGLIDSRTLKSGYLVVIGLVLHDVPEGFAMANAYIGSPSLGRRGRSVYRSSQSA